MTILWTTLGLLALAWAGCFHLHTRNHYARLVDAKEHDE